MGQPYSLCFPDQRAEETSGNPFLSLPVPPSISEFPPSSNISMANSSQPITDFAL